MGYNDWLDGDAELPYELIPQEYETIKNSGLNVLLLYLR